MSTLSEWIDSAVCLYEVHDMKIFKGFRSGLIEKRLNICLFVLSCVPIRRLLIRFVLTTSDWGVNLDK